MIRAASVDDPLRIAVLASGRGSNLAALLGGLDATVRIVAVASNRADAIALARAKDVEIETKVFVRGEDWAERDRLMGDWLAEKDVELVVLAGFLEILTPVFVDRFPTINVHPSLLPAFPGLKAWERACPRRVSPYISSMPVSIRGRRLPRSPSRFDPATTALRCTSGSRQLSTACCPTSFGV